MNDPDQLTRFGPPEFRRPTLKEFEDMLIDDVCEMSKEEIEKELREAGIDMGPAIAKMRAMIDKKIADLAAAPMSETKEETK